MQEKPKILIVDAGPGLNRNDIAMVINTARLEFTHPEQLKEQGIRISIEPPPFVIQNPPEHKNLISLKEEKNYITGKKLPKRKKK